MIKANPPITKEFILTYLSQEEIMEKYLNIYPVEGEFYCSPLRKDKNPTCSFKWINGTLYFKDWAMEHTHDCFSVVMTIYDVSFHEALTIIAKDFDLVQNIRTGSRKKLDVNFSYHKTGSQKSIIQIKKQPFTKNNIQYLKQYEITSDLCNKYNVFSPKYVWLNGKLLYVYGDENPALAYYFGIDKEGNEKWKIYFYTKDEYRFITNTNRINGWIQIPKEGNNLIITKSLKDVMCFDRAGIDSVAMQAESQTPYDYIIDELKQRFNNIVTVFDHDEAGIRRAKKIKELYDIDYYFIKDKNAKDFSDYVKFYGLQEAKEELKLILNGINTNN